MVHTDILHEQDLCTGGLSFLWLEVTRSCNLECVHCYAGSSPFVPNTSLSCVQWETILQESRDEGCTRMQFIGGEPTLNRDLPYLLRRTREIGYDFVEVFSNLTHMPLGVLDAICDTHAHVGVSLYAHEPVVHDAIVRRPHAFERTVQNIKRLMERGISLRVGTIMGMDVRQNEQEMRVFFKNIGVKNTGFDRVRGVGRGRAINTEDFYDALCGACAYGKLVVSADGAMYPCVMSRFQQLGKYPDNSIHDIVCSSALASFRERIRTRNEKALCFPTFLCHPAHKCEPRRPCDPDPYCGPDEPYCDPSVRELLPVERENIRQN